VSELCYKNGWQVDIAVARREAICREMRHMLYDYQKEKSWARLNNIFGLSHSPAMYSPAQQERKGRLIFGFFRFKTSNGHQHLALYKLTSLGVRR
jgi:hypothetical protein